MTSISNNPPVQSTQQTSQTQQSEKAPNNYKSQLEQSGLDATRVQLLDELDGKSDGKIDKSVFDIANGIMNGMTREESVERFGEQLTNEVGKIMDLRNDYAKNPLGDLPMYIDPQDAMQDLGISAQQAGELARLNNSDPSKGIQRGFYMLAEKIVKGEPIDDPSGFFSAQAEAVRNILQPDE